MAVGPTQQDVKVGEWVLIEHGRWTRGITVEENGKEHIVRMVEVKSIMLQSDDLPSEF